MKINTTMKYQCKLITAIVTTVSFLSLATITNGVLLKRSTDLVGTSTEVQTELSTGVKTPSPRTEATPTAAVVAVVLITLWAISYGPPKKEPRAAKTPIHQSEEMLDALP